MPAYKDEKQGTWYCQFYFQDWQGVKKKKKKRGFKTKKEAQEWERSFKLSADASMDMALEAFVEVYFQDKKGELKERSITNKRSMIEHHLMPYFKHKTMNTITPMDIIQWQNVIRSKGYSQTYLRMIQNQITALFNHACIIYDLANNPCKKVKKMGRPDADKLEFWTKEEYDKFISHATLKSYYYVMFEILFWTGCREGELLALTKQDIDFTNNQMHITKTYHRSGGKDIITKPKTEQSIRVIDIPEFLKVEIKEYIDSLCDLSENQRIFPMVAESVRDKLKRQVAKAQVKKIRVHDFRHSHVAYLINQGVQPLIIKERLGHADIKITLNTYGHLYPNQQKQVADMLNDKRK
jgi:integrase